MTLRNAFLIVSCVCTVFTAAAAPLSESRLRENIPVALHVADFLLALQDVNGAIPDVPGGELVNEDSTMEYALIGLASAYEVSGDARYLDGLKKGIEWLAAREEMADPGWVGSWRYTYSSVPPYDPVATSPGPGILDARGVDATSALFVYLLYQYTRLSVDDSLKNSLQTEATAALDFILDYNLAPDGLSYSSWHQWESDGQWHLWKYRYAADQGDVYLGMWAGWLLYDDIRYKSAAELLRQQTPLRFYAPYLKRYAIGIEEDGSLDNSFEGFDGIFPQGYLPWMFGYNAADQAALNWLSSRQQKDGSLYCYRGDPRYSLSSVVYALGALGLIQPRPDISLDWIVRHTYDPADGGIRDTREPESEKISNVAGFTIMALLGFPAFPYPSGTNYLPLILGE